MRWRAMSSALILVAIGGSFLLPAGPAAAQGNQNTCQQFIRRVINELGTSCARLDSNSICYGYDDAEALPIEGISWPVGAFDAPGDRLPVTEVASVTTSEFDLDGRTWGFAVVKIDAYTGLNEQTGEPETAELLYILPGGVELEAATMPEYDENGDLILDDEHWAPLQKAYLRNLFDAPECREAIPPFLFVQSEPDEVIDLVINDALIRLEGTILLEVLPNFDRTTGDRLRLTTIYGMATVNPDSPNETLVPPGFFVEICLDEEEDLGLDRQENDQPVGDCDWTAPQPLSQDDLNRMPSLNLLPRNIMFYNIVIPRIVVASGIGGPSNRFFFVNPAALRLAREACDAGLIPEPICNFLF